MSRTIRYNKSKRSSGVGETVLGAFLVVLLVVVLVAALLLFGGLIFWAAWNLGLVPLVAALGGSISKIGFWTAVGINFALGVIGSFFKSNKTEA